jgi:two-component system, NarL family, response regulator LiaR
MLFPLYTTQMCNKNNGLNTFISYSMIITVAIVENDKHYAALLKKTIDATSDLACVGTFHSIQESLTGLANTIPDVVLLEAELILLNNNKFIPILQSISPSTKIILMGTDNTTNTSAYAKMGVIGHVIKTESVKKIIERVSSAMKTLTAKQKQIKKKAANQVSIIAKNMEILTPRELEMLQYLADGLFYKEIAKKEKITIDTVKKHCSTIYKKLKVQNRTEAVNHHNLVKSV